MFDFIIFLGDITMLFDENYFYMILLFIFEEDTFKGLWLNALLFQIVASTLQIATKGKFFFY